MEWWNDGIMMKLVRAEDGINKLQHTGIFGITVIEQQPTIPTYQYSGIVQCYQVVISTPARWAG